MTAVKKPEPEPQPVGRSVNLEVIVNRQSQLIGDLQTQLIVRDIALAGAEAELAELKAGRE